MEKPRLLLILAALAALALVVGCGPGAAPSPAAAIVTEAPARTPTRPAPTPTATLKPTFTPTPPPTPTPTPEPTLTPTDLPGQVVIPITSMKKAPPWLKHAYDPNAMPGTLFYAFNTAKPPFDNVLVRRAFAAAVDREAVAAIASRLYWRNVQPATSYIPPQVLGRYLYNEVGIRFEPDRARELLAAAGYSEPAAFPTPTLYISASRAEAPGAYLQMAEAVVEMWKEYLGIDVGIRSIGYVGDLQAYLENNPTGYEIYRMGFVMGAADELDPRFIETFHSEPERNQGANFAHFQNAHFDLLLDRALWEPDPARRQLLYIEAERVLCEKEAVLIPLYHMTFP